MPTITISGLTDAQERQPLISGPYELEVASAKVLTREKDGSLALQVEFLVVDGPMQRDESPAEGRKAYDFFQLTGTETHKDGGNFARARLKNFLQAVGVEITDVLDFDDICTTIVGERVTSRNRVETNNGEEREKWMKYQAS